MTICIAALCDKNFKAIVASDRMITVMPLSQEFEHGTSKIQTIAKTCAAVTAGSALLPSELCKAVEEPISKLGKPHISQIVDEIKKQYVELRKKRIEEEVLKPRGLTIETFYKNIGKLPPQIAIPLDNKIESYDEFRLDVLIGGVDDSGGHIYQVSNPGISECFDILGYSAIGSGEPHAISSFIANDYTGLVSLNEGVYMVYEAKKRSEKAPGVGPSTDMCVIDKKVEPISDAVMANLNKIYKMKTAYERKRTKKINQAIQNLKITSS